MPVTVEGIDKVVSAMNAFQDLKQRLVSEVLVPTAENILEEARSVVPVRTGFLRSTIQMGEVTDTQVRGGAYAPYAGFVEFGTSRFSGRHYLEPSVMKGAIESESLVLGLLSDMAGGG